jgi:hypothetical protein
MFSLFSQKKGTPKTPRGDINRVGSGPRTRSQTKPPASFPAGPLSPKNSKTKKTKKHIYPGSKLPPLPPVGQGNNPNGCFGAAAHFHANHFPQYGTERMTTPEFLKKYGSREAQQAYQEHRPFDIDAAAGSGSNFDPSLFTSYTSPTPGMGIPASGISRDLNDGKPLVGVFGGAANNPNKPAHYMNITGTHRPSGGQRQVEVTDPAANNGLGKTSWMPAGMHGQHINSVGGYNLAGLYNGLSVPRPVTDPRKEKVTDPRKKKATGSKKKKKK